MAGLTSDGLEVATFDEIKSDIEADLKADLGASLNLSATSVFGQLIGTVTDRIADLHQLLQAVYRSFHPDSATGDALENVAAITGVTRLGATKSTFSSDNTPSNPLTVNLNAGVTLPVGRIVRVPDGPRFITTEEVTNSGGSPADVSVDAEAEDAGAVVANAATVTEIVTPVSGWNSVTNAADASVGREIETDAELRVRREQLLRVQGAGTVEAIRADVLDVSGVTQATVFNNPSSTTDGDGVPPHAFEVVVLGGDEADLREAIWAASPAGIQSHGDVSGTITDSQGFSQTVEFSRPTTTDIWVLIELTTDSAYPVDGDDQVAEAIVAFGDTFLIGQDVITTQLYSAIFGISGVTDVTKLWIGTSDPPTNGNNITIGNRAIASFDTSRVSVTST